MSSHCFVSCLLLGPKTDASSGLNDFRPVGLTLHIMKGLERLVSPGLAEMLLPLFSLFNRFM